jgi:hypothetical protein
MTKLSAADLMVICDTLNHSLRVLNYGGFTEETRKRTMEKVIAIMENMEVDVVHKDEEQSFYNTLGDKDDECKLSEV